jgi:hypothetical protein
MRVRRNKDAGRDYVSLLAASFVMVGGLLTCGMIVASSASKPARPALLSLLAVVGLALVVWLLRDRNESVAKERFFGFLRARPPEPPEYEPRVRRAYQAAGDTQPPTVEKLRELRQNVNTWVPSQQVGRKKPRR